MDSLEIEPLSKSMLRVRDNRIKEIGHQLEKIELTISPTQEFMQESFQTYLKEHPEEEIVKQIKKMEENHKKWLLENPEWEKQQKEESDKYEKRREKWEKEHPELVEESRKGDIIFNEFLENRYTEEEKRYNKLEDKYNDLSVKIDSIEDILKKYKKTKK